jgi:multiple sugar transport system permease protein
LPILEEHRLAVAARPNSPLHPRSQAVAFMAPALVLSGAFVLYPLVNGVRLAFTDASPLSRTTRWVGFDNFSYLLADPDFWEVLANSLGLVSIAIALSLSLGFLLALLLDTGLRWTGVFRTGVFLVWVVPWISIAILWGWLFNADFGLNNYLLQRLGIIDEPLNFLAGPYLARAMLIWGFVWRLIPFMMVVSMAAIQGVPRELREAASLDGAGYWRQQFYVVLPLVRQTLAVVALLQSVKLLQEITLPWVLTRGGPVNATTVLSLYTYKLAFDRWEFGLASAAGVLWLLLVAIIAFAFTRRVAQR